MKLWRPGNHCRDSPGDARNHAVVTFHQAYDIRLMDKAGQMTTLQSGNEVCPVPFVEFNILKPACILLDAAAVRNQNKLSIAEVREHSTVSIQGSSIERAKPQDPQRTVRRSFRL